MSTKSRRPTEPFRAKEDRVLKLHAAQILQDPDSSPSEITSAKERLARAPDDLQAEVARIIERLTPDELATYRYLDHKIRHGVPPEHMAHMRLVAVEEWRLAMARTESPSHVAEEIHDRTD